MLTTLKNKVHLSKALALLGSILLIISLFLPFASATDDYKDSPGPHGGYRDPYDQPICHQSFTR